MDCDVNHYTIISFTQGKLVEKTVGFLYEM